ncbi:MAG: TetR/AcrR family transcriptional regulator [Gammaproteobacteria bacterium]|nr:TetR/AcrR family transcriptional regulator [Gammaproteobacteria bacterium]
MEPQPLAAPGKSIRKSHAERTELSDSLMLDACIDLIVEQGTEKTTLKAVGELAGYSRGLAGARFKSKSGLFSFVIKRVAEYWRDEMEKLTTGKIGYPAICAAIDAHYRFCQKTPRSFKAFYILWFESIGFESEIREVVVAIHQRRLSDVSHWIKQGIEAGELAIDIDAEAVARHFLTSMFGIVYQWLIDPQQEREIRKLHDQLKQTMRLLLPAVTPPIGN